MNLNKLGLLGVVFALVAGLSVSAIGFSVYLYPPATYDQLRPMISIDALGQASTLDGIRRALGVDFGLPTSLPPGTMLREIRVGKSMAALVYDNPNLPKIPFYDKGVLVIVVLSDGTSFGAPETAADQPMLFITQDNSTTAADAQMFVEGIGRARTVTVAGNPGWGYDPADFKVYHDSGRLEWWSNGIHYIMHADLPLLTLIEIAESMNK